MERAPCPKCGAQKLHIDLMLSDTVQIHASMAGVAKNPSLPSKKRSRIWLFSGDKLRKAKGDWVEKERVIDRDNNRYFERVSDKATGEVIHEAEEPLSDHRGHGSAKQRERP